MKKKTIKINFKYFTEGFDPEDNFFINLLRKKYKVVISDKPDYLFYSVYNTKSPPKGIEIIGKIIKRLSPGDYLYSRRLFSKAFSFIFKKRKLETRDEIIKIFYGAEHTRSNMKECDWAFGSHFEEEINHPKYMRLLPYLLNDYTLPRLGNPPIKKNIDLEKIKKEKTKFCNFIYSQDIPFRNNFFKRLNKYKKIDAPGRAMNNMPPINANNPKQSRASKNWVMDKLDFLKPYKFTIAFENKSESGWVTEKLTHPMLVNSIPIYFGHKDINKDFNTKSFINYGDFKNIEDLIKHIIKVDNDDTLYKEYLEQSPYKNNNYSRDIHINDKKILKRFKEIFG